MKIQSYSSIITNSSSEVFVKYDRKSVDGYKEIIKNLLNVVGYSGDLDKMIDIIPDLDYDRSEVIQCWQDDKDTDVQPTDDDLIDYLYANTDKSFKCGEQIYPMVKQIIVKAKSPEYEEVANLIKNLINHFESKELYC